MSRTWKSGRMVNHPYKVIEDMRTFPSKTYKEEVLKKYKDDRIMRKVMRYGYDPNHVYGIRDFKIDLPEALTLANDNYSKGELELMFSVLDSLIYRKYKGKGAIKVLQELVPKLCKNSCNLLYLIIDKDFKCGINKKSIIKGMGKGVINKPPYMGALGFSPERLERLFELSEDGYVFAENKADGLYGGIVIDKTNDLYYIESRHGKLISGMDVLIEAAKELDYEGDFVITGEVMLRGKSRHIANGLVSSINSIYTKKAKGMNISGEITKFKIKTGMELSEATELVYMKSWDIIPLGAYNDRECSTPRHERLSELENACCGQNVITPINYIRTNKLEDCYNFFTEQLMLDLEGLIVKTTDGIWKDGRPVWQVKMKIEFISDLKVVGFKEGKKGTKFEGSLGSLICVSEDLMLTADVSGLSDMERLEIWSNQDDYVDRVIEVKCNGLSCAKDSMVWSMLHPVVNKDGVKATKWRFDKLEANTLEEIQDIEESKKTLG